MDNITQIYSDLLNYHSSTDEWLDARENTMTIPWDLPSRRNIADPWLNSSVHENEVEGALYASGFYMFVVYHAVRGLQSVLGITGNIIILVILHR